MILFFVYVFKGKYFQTVLTSWEILAWQTTTLKWIWMFTVDNELDVSSQKKELEI